MTTFSLTSPDMLRDPYPGYAAVRRAGKPVPVKTSYAGTNTYFVTTYDDALAILKDPRFINDSRRLPTSDDWTGKWYIPAVIKSFADSMALADEPDHTRLRSLVHKGFTPRMIGELAGSIERLSNELLDAAERKDVIDFMADFALPLPLNVICDMMGVDPRDRHNLHRWMGDNITDASPDDGLRLIPKLLNAMGLGRYLKRLVRERRRNPQDDLTSALVQAEESGDSLSEDELIAMLMLILFAGHETTVNLIGSGTLALLQHPDQFELLKARPDLLDSAIEELLRYTNPVHHIAPRFALEDVEIGGVTIPQYGTVLVGVAAANRDETVFERADELDITRSPNKHIAFGFGIHYCLGAPLARLEAKIAFETLFRRFPNLQLAADPATLAWKGAPALRGLKRLPMRLSG